MPSFVARVERPDRGGEWIAYLEERAQAASAGPRGWGSTARAARRAAGPAVRLLSVRGQRGRPARGAAVRGRRLLGGGGAPRGARRSRPTSARRCWPSWSASAGNRRHRPGRGFEALRYRFEVVSDYGAFRDLQRHRMLTVQWQTLGPDLGAGVPEELEQAGVADAYRAGLERSREEYARLAAAGPAGAGALRALPRLPDPLRARHERARGDAPDRAALGPRGPPGLPRRRARPARRDRARPPGGGGGDELVDRDTEPRLERILSEIRAHAKQTARASAQLHFPGTVRGAPTDQGGCPLRQRTNGSCSASWPRQPLRS